MITTSGAKIRGGDWVVVCDGRKALILQNAGDEKFLNLRIKEVREHPDAPTHELGADAPGRVHQSTYRSSSSVGQTDWHDESERSFLRALAERLDLAVRNAETRMITLVIAPRALGMIREFYSDKVSAALRAEVAKDLVKSPISEIEKHLLS